MVLILAIHQAGNAPATSALSAQRLAFRPLVVVRKVEESNPYSFAIP